VVCGTATACGNAGNAVTAARLGGLQQVQHTLSLGVFKVVVSWSKFLRRVVVWERLQKEVVEVEVMAKILDHLLAWSSASWLQAQP